MSRYGGERQMINEVQSSIYGARRSLTDAIRYGTTFRIDVAEIFLTLAKAEAQLHLLNIKIDATERMTETTSAS